MLEYLLRTGNMRFASLKLSSDDLAEIGSKVGSRCTLSLYMILNSANVLRSWRDCRRSFQRAESDLRDFLLTNSL